VLRAAGALPKEEEEPPPPIGEFLLMIIVSHSQLIALLWRALSPDTIDLNEIVSSIGCNVASDGLTKG